jgi:pSer/pThr/pTyr-binding forkhead associated (FHA) protein
VPRAEALEKAMNAHVDASLPVTQPALILLYGTPGATQVGRLLDRDAILVGRSRGCDLVLESPAVSSIHCVVSRSAGGYSIRDCASRAGTRLNGEPVEEASLHDGDLVQIGPFSFRVALPVVRKVGAVPSDEPRQVRLERKRRSLVELALALRRRLHQLRQGEAQQAAGGAALAAKRSGVRPRSRDYEQRLLQVEQAERDLSRQRDLFTREQAAFQARIQAVERELAFRKAEVEAEAARRRQELRG